MPIPPGGDTTTQRLSCSAWYVSSTNVNLSLLQKFDRLIVVFDHQRYMQNRLFHVNRNPGSDPFLIFDCNGLIGTFRAGVQRLLRFYENNFCTINRHRPVLHAFGYDVKLTGIK